MQFTDELFTDLKQEVDYAFDIGVQGRSIEYSAKMERQVTIRRVSEFVIGCLIAGTDFFQREDLGFTSEQANIVASSFILYCATEEGLQHLRILLERDTIRSKFGKHFLREVGRLDGKLSEEFGTGCIFFSVLTDIGMELKAFSLRDIQLVYGSNTAKKVIFKSSPEEILSGAGLFDFARSRILRNAILAVAEPFGMRIKEKNYFLIDDGGSPSYESEFVQPVSAIGDDEGSKDVFSAEIHFLIELYSRVLGEKVAVDHLIGWLSTTTSGMPVAETKLSVGLKVLWEKVLTPLMERNPCLRLALKAPFDEGALGTVLANAGAIVDSIQAQDKAIFFDRDISASDLLKVLRLGIYPREQVAFLGMDAALKKEEIHVDFSL